MKIRLELRLVSPSIKIINGVAVIGDYTERLTIIRKCLIIIEGFKKYSFQCHLTYTSRDAKVATIHSPEQPAPFQALSLTTCLCQHQ